MLLSDVELNLIEDVLDNFYMHCPSEFNFGAKLKLDAKLEQDELKLDNDDINLIYKAFMMVSNSDFDMDMMSEMTSKFSQLSMMISV
jgi:hypothetical protein